MHTLLIVVAVIVVIVIVALVAFDAGKSNYYGIPLPVSHAVPGNYKVLSYVKTETGESFAVMQRTEDDEIMCVDVTPLKNNVLQVGNTIRL